MATPPRDGGETPSISPGHPANTGEPEILGLESVFGDRATLRLTVRTRPEAQFSVQRELRALIKKSFEDQGIKLANELPRPQGGSL